MPKQTINELQKLHKGGGDYYVVLDGDKAWQQVLTESDGETKWQTLVTTTGLVQIATIPELHTQKRSPSDDSFFPSLGLSPGAPK